MDLLRACVVMLPRLQAEEALLGVTATALGTGSLKSAEARSTMDRLSSAVAGGSGRSRAVPAHPGVLAEMGIGVREVTG
jgi:hypothetical protein